MAWSRTFEKCIFYHFLKTFLLKMDFAKKLNVCKFANFLTDYKSRAYDLSNDVSFVIFGYQTRDFYMKT